MQLTQVNHIGVSVRNLDRSIEFYRDLTGGELEFVNDMYGPGISRVIGDEGARLHFCLLKLGNTVLELLLVFVLEFHPPHSLVFLNLLLLSPFFLIF